MKKTITAMLVAAFLAIASVYSLKASPAMPGFRRYVQPDGSTLVLELRGDEFGHWYADKAGKTYTRGADGFFVPESPDLVTARSAARSRMIREAEKVRRNPRMIPGSGFSDKINTGTRHIPVILVDFQDVKFTTPNPQQAFDAMLNQEDYSDNGCDGSVHDYFVDNSDGKFIPFFDVYGPVTLDHDMAYYGTNRDETAEEFVWAAYAVLEGCEKLDSQIDFSQYDSRNYGQVDMILMYFAGTNEAEHGPDDSIWPHQWDIEGAGANAPDSLDWSVRNSFDGKVLTSYFCTSELSAMSFTDDGAIASTAMAGPGTTCHEFSHSLGLIDIYDTDYTTNGRAGATYGYDLMSRGNYNNHGKTPPYMNAVELIMLGWKTEDEILPLPADGSVSLPAFAKGKSVTYKSTTTTDDEYFLYETRGVEGWDKYIAEGNGLVVYHVDESSSRNIQSKDSYGNLTTMTPSEVWEAAFLTNALNENGSHPCFYVVPSGAQNYEAADVANGTAGLNYNGDWFAFGTGMNTYTPLDWNGNENGGYTMTIKYDSSLNTTTICTGSYISNDDIVLFTTIKNPGRGVYTLGGTFALELNESTKYPVKSTEWYYDDEPVSGGAIALDKAGRHVVTARITTASGSEKLDLVIEVQ